MCSRFRLFTFMCSQGGAEVLDPFRDYPIGRTNIPERVQYLSAGTPCETERA